MRIEYLYRFPVKGLTAEAIESVELAEGDCIPWDRAFALAQGDSAFDPAQPKWLPKQNFLCLMRNERAALLRSSFEPRSGVLSIRAPDGSSVAENALDPAGRERIGAFLTQYLAEDARGAPRFHHVPNHSFSDVSRKVVSMINLASLQSLEAAVQARRHRRRFRANIWFAGAAAWTEFDWMGRDLLLGGATIRVIKRIARCPATEVNPETGERDAEPVQELLAAFGHR